MTVMPQNNLPLPESGLYVLTDSDRRAAFEKTACAAGYAILSSDLSHCRSKRTCLEHLGRDLGLPDYYGANFDALADCLGDPDWHPAAGHLILVSGLASLHGHDTPNFATLIEVFASAAEERRAAGEPFIVMIDFPAYGAVPLPGA